jgi:hypothetical protein
MHVPKIIKGSLDPLNAFSSNFKALTINEVVSRTGAEKGIMTILDQFRDKDCMKIQKHQV